MTENVETSVTVWGMACLKVKNCNPIIIFSPSCHSVELMRADLVLVELFLQNVKYFRSFWNVEYACVWLNVFGLECEFPQKRAEQTSGSTLVMTVAWRCVYVLTWTGWRPDRRPGCPLQPLGAWEEPLGRGGMWSILITPAWPYMQAPLWVNNIWKGTRVTLR